MKCSATSLPNKDGNTYCSDVPRGSKFNMDFVKMQKTVRLLQMPLGYLESRTVGGINSVFIADVINWGVICLKPANQQFIQWNK